MVEAKMFMKDGMAGGYVMGDYNLPADFDPDAFMKTLGEKVIRGVMNGQHEAIAEMERQLALQVPDLETRQQQAACAIAHGEVQAKEIMAVGSLHDAIDEAPEMKSRGRPALGKTLDKLMIDAEAQCSTTKTS